LTETKSFIKSSPVFHFLVVSPPGQLIDPPERATEKVQDSAV
jgi:hypothetical protein